MHDVSSHLQMNSHVTSRTRSCPGTSRDFGPRLPSSRTSRIADRPPRSLPSGTWPSWQRRHVCADFADFAWQPMHDLVNFSQKVTLIALLERFVPYRSDFQHFPTRENPYDLTSRYLTWRPQRLLEPPSTITTRQTLPPIPRTKATKANPFQQRCAEAPAISAHKSVNRQP